MLVGVLGFFYKAVPIRHQPPTILVKNTWHIAKVLFSVSPSLPQDQQWEAAVTHFVMVTIAVTDTGSWNERDPKVKGSALIAGSIRSRQKK